VDGEGEQIVNVWKTWSYNTIITIWNGTPLRTSGEVRLQDVFLRNDV